ncbi:MAG: branched-chain amino acid ABC transporter permease [Proteobacteria bacterium]|nr:branched-chain amino acid ABC transporter permease [Pseudomonadota bacterium]
MLSGYIESILIFNGIHIIMALSLYLPFSAGQISLAQAGFMAIGAYATSVMTLYFGFPFYIALFIGGLLSAMTGVLVGFPALRIKGIYLLLLTLAFGEMVRVFFLNFELTGGASGMGGMDLKTNLFNVYTIVALLILFFHRLSGSRMGRAFESMREDEIAAEVTGINVVKAKLIAFGVGAFIAGLGGGLYAHYVMYIDSPKFGFLLAVEFFVFVVFGGMEIFWGSIVGATLLTLIPEVVRFLKDWRMIFYGLVIVVLMIVRPQGLIDKKLVRDITLYTKKCFGMS